MTGTIQYPTRAGGPQEHTPRVNDVLWSRFDDNHSKTANSGVRAVGSYDASAADPHRFKRLSSSMSEAFSSNENMDSSSSPEPAATFPHGSTKTAAPRALRNLRALWADKGIAETNALAKTMENAGAIKRTPLGSTLQQEALYGGEAIVDPVVGAVVPRSGRGLPGADDAVKIRKNIDTYGPVYSKTHLAAKGNVARRLANPLNQKPGLNFANQYGGVQRTPEGAKFTLNQHVGDFTQGGGSEADYSLALRGLEKINPYAKDALKVRAAKRAPLIKEFRRRGLSKAEASAKVDEMIPREGNPILGDLHHENVVTRPDGSTVALDYIAKPSHEIATQKRLLGDEGIHTQRNELLGMAGGPQDLHTYLRTPDVFRPYGSATPASAFRPSGAGSLHGGPRHKQFNPSLSRTLGPGSGHGPVPPPPRGTPLHAAEMEKLRALASGPDSAAMQQLSPENVAFLDQILNTTSPNPRRARLALEQLAASPDPWNFRLADVPTASPRAPTPAATAARAPSAIKAQRSVKATETAAPSTITTLDDIRSQVGSADPAALSALAPEERQSILRAWNGDQEEFSIAMELLDDVAERVVASPTAPQYAGNTPTHSLLRRPGVAHPQYAAGYPSMDRQRPAWIDRYRELQAETGLSNNRRVPIPQPKVKTGSFSVGSTLFKLPPDITHVKLGGPGIGGFNSGMPSSSTSMMGLGNAPKPPQAPSAPKAVSPMKPMSAVDPRANKPPGMNLQHSIQTSVAASDSQANFGSPQRRLLGSTV